MPRIGMNPSRGKKTTYYPARVSIAVLTYLPEEAGYFSQRLDVTKLCLESIIRNTRVPYDLLVFDNGSSDKLVNYLRSLQDKRFIDYLWLSSRNIGKIAALQIIARSAPGEIIAYSDDDVFFMPGWLEQHLQILDTFPNAGFVTGFYIRDHLKYGMQSLEHFCLRDDVDVRTGNFWDEQWIQHFVDNMGRTREQYEQEMAGLRDILLEYKGVKALASAGHHQFVTFKTVLQNALPAEWQNNLMGQMVSLENKIDAMGYLRLSTPQPVTRLLGNVLEKNMRLQAKQFGLHLGHQQGVDQKRPLFKWFKYPWVRKIVWRIYHWAYNVVTSQ